MKTLPNFCWETQCSLPLSVEFFWRNRDYRIVTKPESATLFVEVKRTNAMGEDTWTPWEDVNSGASNEKNEVIAIGVRKLMFDKWKSASLIKRVSGEDYDGC